MWRAKREPLVSLALRRRCEREVAAEAYNLSLNPTHVASEILPAWWLLDLARFDEAARPTPLSGPASDRRWTSRLYWLDPAMPRLLEENLPSNPTAALRQCEDRLREALLLLAATRLFNQLYERNTR